jgi:hypothetical protein
VLVLLPLSRKKAGIFTWKTASAQDIFFVTPATEQELLAASMGRSPAGLSTNLYQISSGVMVIDSWTPQGVFKRWAFNGSFGRLKELLSRYGYKVKYPESIVLKNFMGFAGNGLVSLTTFAAASN